MKINDVITQSFKKQLIENLNKIGITTSSIECILLEGSALYLQQPNDIDFKVILKRYFNKAEMRRCFFINGYTVECVYYTFDDWANVTKYKSNAQYIVESKDMICIYGNDSKFFRYDVVTNKELQSYIINVYDKLFFNYKENDKTNKMSDKRLWNFLLFAFKLQNNDDNLSDEQLELLQKAHDLELNKEDYLPLFNELKERILITS